MTQRSSVVVEAVRDEVGKEALDEVLGVLRVLPSPPSKGVQGPPIALAQLAQGFRSSWGAAPRRLFFGKVS